MAHEVTANLKQMQPVEQYISESHSESVSDSKKKDRKEPDIKKAIYKWQTG